MKTKISLILSAPVFLLLLTAVNPTLAEYRAGRLPFGIERLERRAAPSIVTAVKAETTIESLSPAAPGDIDPTFGNGGIVVTPITDAANLYDEPNSMLVQPDGKIVVCGQVNYSDDETGYPVSFFLARYNPTGTLDISFGANGKVIAPIGGSGGGVYVGQNIALQPDGKILAVGHIFFPGGSSFAVNRYNPDGSLDASFGTGGTVLTSGVNGAYDVAVQPDGKIIVIGSAFVSGQDNNFAVVRYNPDGSLDNSFGTGGKVITPVGNGNVVDQAYAVALQPDGRIVVVGTSLFRGVSGYDLALVRYNANGSLDSGFGANGKIIHSITNEHEIASDVALQPDGQIVVVGDNRFGVAPAAIVRYNADGSVDTSFAANGIFRTERDFFSGRSIALQPDGKILAFGSGRIAENSFFVFAVVRLNPNGSPDFGFGAKGRLITPIGDGSGAVAGALQPDGKILAYGETSAGIYTDIALVRYLSDLAASCSNPIDCAEIFVRQHYFDFLNREPDANGLGFWTNEITSCGADQGCIDAKRINVSAAFFLSIEFQQTGYLVYRFYKASYVNLPGALVPIKLSEFLPDTKEIGQGVVVNQAGWEQLLENNKQAFTSEFVQRSRFVSAYPTSMSSEQFVDALFANAGVTPSATDRAAAINEFTFAATTADVAARARALRRVAENSTLAQQEFNRAFVLMQYFGYLRRNPNDPPEPTLDFQGYNFWLNKLSQFNGSFQDAEMVKAFLVSTEYRQRFAP